MTTEEFEAQLQKLTATINTLPQPDRDRLLEMVEQTRERSTQIKENGRRAQDALDDLRIQYKYMLFDREASARERGEQA